MASRTMNTVMFKFTRDHNPCKQDCADRCVGCRSSCERYAKFLEEKDAFYQSIAHGVRSEAVYNTYCTGVTVRNQNIWNKMKNGANRNK